MLYSKKFHSVINGFILLLNRILGFLSVNSLITFLIFCVYVCMWVNVCAYERSANRSQRTVSELFLYKRLQELELQEVVGCSMWVLKNELYSLLQEQYELITTINPGLIYFLKKERAARWLWIKGLAVEQESWVWSLGPIRWRENCLLWPTCPLAPTEN